MPVQQFAQVSDPHLSTLEGVQWRQLLSKRALGYISWRRRRRFEHRREVLDALQRDLEQFNLEQLLVTGDLTHVGLPMEFRQALQWLQQLGPPRDVLVIPGNHDASVATPWADSFALWQDYMASDCACVTEDGLFPSWRVRGETAFIGLSTACPKPPFMATGTVSAQQLARLPGLLDRARQQGLFRVVHLHHSPLPGKEVWRKRLTNAAQVLQIIVAHGAELVLYGHGHRAHYDELATTQGIAPVIAIPSASAMGMRGNPAGYNCYRVERAAQGWQLEIDPRRYLPEQKVFTAGESRTVTLTRDRLAD